MHVILIHYLINILSLLKNKSTALVLGWQMYNLYLHSDRSKYEQDEVVLSFWLTFPFYSVQPIQYEQIYDLLFARSRVKITVCLLKQQPKAGISFTFFNYKTKHMMLISM